MYNGYPVQKSCLKMYKGPQRTDQIGIYFYNSMIKVTWYTTTETGLWIGLVFTVSVTGKVKRFIKHSD